MIKRAYVTVSTPLSTNDYGILSRNFKYSCTDCIVHVWLSYTDCGCLESATRMGNDSDPAPQTNLGLTSLYSLLFLSQQESYLWIDYPQVRFLHMVFKGSTCRGVYMGSMLVAHHFFQRDFALGFSNSKPMYTFLKIFARLKTLRESGSFGL